LRIAPSGYPRHAAELRDPSCRCARAIRDERLRPEIKRVWQANMQGYDNALAETINGLYKAELIHRRVPWKTR
jgi:hypothetical protein